MSNNDFIKGYNQGYNNAYRPSPSQPQTETKVVERVVTQYDNSASLSLANALVKQRADSAGQSAVVYTLKKALHEIAPDHPLINPIRTANNPITNQIYDNAHDFYLENKFDPIDEAYEAIALSKGEPRATPEPAVPAQSSAEASDESKPVKEKKGGFWGWFNNPTGVGV